ncbi:MAG: periplasmic heavy metal sensor [Chloroflexi bacterium]|nr:MAG: periplasmic heavy metal sensor [Chloroflexota bacterium]
MRKAGLVLLLGVVACIAAFACFYFMGTAASRELMRQPQPELAWLKKEFNLADAEFARISALHEAYLPRCAERCRLIEEQNAKVRSLLDQATVMTPEIRAVIAERARIRAQCEAEMLEHFLEVSRTMPSAQGRRYLAWVEQQSSLRGEGMEARHRNQESSPQPHQH